MMVRLEQGPGQHAAVRPDKAHIHARWVQAKHTDYLVGMAGIDRIVVAARTAVVVVPVIFGQCRLVVHPVFGHITLRPATTCPASLPAFLLS